ncbi:GGDEF domain-containing protein [Piscinibacter sakaiensis]|uniref:GGDEF domain-containing protein n=1 Tax=Piscinibacter sakaiensis TaxID=1547922 RepID=UPI003AAF8E8E
MQSPTWRYTAIGALFGLMFPLVSAALLLATGTVQKAATFGELVAAVHAHSPLLYVIDTAPIFLGIFAGFAGVRQSRLIALNASLEQQIATQTASLRKALQQAEKTNVMISHMADHDPLTGLLNRRRMHRELVAAVSDARRHGDELALVFVDLDRFKAINDRHGHEAGDRFLGAFSALLELAARDTDKIGRWGGDEFVILLPRTTEPGAAQFCSRLEEILDGDGIDIGPARVPAAASIGVALYPADGADPATLLAHADRRMYRVKKRRDEPAPV